MSRKAFRLPNPPPFKKEETRMSIDNVTRRAALALCAALALSVPAAAQTWPDKPVRLVVNFPPGGVADTLARSIAPGISDAIKQPVVVENRPGANGMIGAEVVAKSPADGYTFLVTSGGAMTIDPFIYSNIPYDTQKDLTPVAALAVVRVYLLVHPSVPAKSLHDFVAYLRANPGKLSYGSAGSGSSPHIAAEMFKRAAKVDAVHVPYKGAAPALNDLLGGQVQFMFDPGPGLQHAATGKLTVLAVASGKRASQYPDVPTLEELGLRVDADTTFGVYAPAGVSPAIVERMNREINRTLSSPQLVDNMARLGGAVAPMTIQEFVNRQAADRARYGAFIKEAGIKVD
jgi:tripartite-type tricarboxylate transporter receptor subunit TctC